MRYPLELQPDENGTVIVRVVDVPESAHPLYGLNVGTVQFLSSFLAEGADALMTASFLVSDSSADVLVCSSTIFPHARITSRGEPAPTWASSRWTFKPSPA